MDGEDEGETAIQGSRGTHRQRCTERLRYSEAEVHRGKDTETGIRKGRHPQRQRYTERQEIHRSRDKQTKVYGRNRAL